MLKCCAVGLKCGTRQREIMSRLAQMKRNVCAQISRQKLKKIKTRLKNEWLLQQLQQCNDSILPGGRDRKSAKAMWALGEKLQRGVDKWRPWSGKNVRDKDGVIGTSPTENAQNFKACYEELFSNEVVDSTAAGRWCSQVEDVNQDREWTPPTSPELKKAVSELKNTAPGLSGMPGSVLKMLCASAKCRGCLSQMMIECWNSGKVPVDWTSYHLTVLPKKGDLSYQATAEA
jgi:hypothetical protein